MRSWTGPFFDVRILSASSGSCSMKRRSGSKDAISVAKR
jgi:hypothetical protein